MEIDLIIATVALCVSLGHLAYETHKRKANKN